MKSHSKIASVCWIALILLAASQMRLAAQFPIGGGVGNPPVQGFAPVPNQNYVVIDMSGATTGTNTAIGAVALDDQNNFAFGYVSGTDAEGNTTEYTTYTCNGAPTTATLVQSVDCEPDDSFLYVQGIDSAGNVYGQDGTVSISPGSLQPNSTLFIDRDGDLQDLYPSLPYSNGTDSDDGTVNDPGLEIELINSAGVYTAAVFGFVAVPTDSNPNAGYMAQFSSIFGTQEIVSSNGTAIFDSQAPDGSWFGITAISGSGTAIGVAYDAGDSENESTFWDGEDFDFLTFNPVALNNAGMVVGSDVNFQPYIWSSGSGAISLTTLVPPQYQNEVTYLYPTRISGTNANGGYYITGGMTYKTDAAGDTANAGFVLTITSGTGTPAQNLFAVSSAPLTLSNFLGGTVPLSPQGISAGVAPVSDTNGNVSQPQAVLMVPVGTAPGVLRVNSSFNEQKIDSTTNYAQPDNYDESLIVATGPNAGKITVNGLSSNFFGIKPGTLNNSFYQGATVTIKKLDNIDSETGNTETGTIRLYAIQNLGQSGEQAYPIPISNSGGTTYTGVVPFTTSISTDDPANLVSVLYSNSATIPSGSNVGYYMEGVDPGPITLEFRIHTGTGTSQDIVYQQHFLVCTQQSKGAWQADIRQEILLQTTNVSDTVDMYDYSLTNSFMTNRPYIQAIYGYYQELFDQEPQLFLWAGLAKLAGGPVYAGMSDLQWTQNDLELWTIYTNVDLGASFSASVCAFLQGALMEGNQDIFDDMAWQFRAYQASGVWALRYASDNHQDTVYSNDRPIDEDTWNRMFQGETQNQSNLIANANLLLTQREQQYIVDASMKRIDLISDANHLFSQLATSPVDKVNDASFVALLGIFGDVTDYQQRWRWIIYPTRGIWHTWNNLSQSAQTSIVDIPLRTRASQYSFLSSSSYPIW
jgi:hypothetical protein